MPYQKCLSSDIWHSLVSERALFQTVTSHDIKPHGKGTWEWSKWYLFKCHGILQDESNGTVGGESALARFIPKFSIQDMGKSLFPLILWLESFSSAVLGRVRSIHCWQGRPWAFWCSVSREAYGVNSKTCKQWIWIHGILKMFDLLYNFQKFSLFCAEITRTRFA